MVKTSALFAGLLTALAIATPAAAAPVAGLVADAEPGPSGSSAYEFSAASEFTAVGDTIFFAANVGTSRTELWRTDGTAAGTAMVKDIDPTPLASSRPRYLTAFGGALYFSAKDDTHGTELWRSDGTAGGTVIVKDIRLGQEGSFPSAFVALGNFLYFRADDGVNGNELWRTDGTRDGTTIVKNIRPGPDSSDPDDDELPFAHGGFLYFGANDGTNGNELWRTDGTTTEMVMNIYGGDFSSDPREFAALGDFVYFQAGSSTRGTELWRTDGTAANTDQVKSINSTAVGADSNPSGLTRFGDFLYFQADDGINGYELWRTGGTSANTTMVANIEPPGGFAGGSYPDGFTPLGNFLYFRANDGIHGSELWRTDGTSEGTTPFEINPNGANGSDGSGPFYLTVLGDSLYFLAEDGTSGEELWRTDGTSTTLVADIFPGKQDSEPGPFTKVGDALYFGANDGTHGREVWRLAEPPPTPPPAADTTAPKLDLSSKKSQKLDKSVEVTVGCDEACDATATGKITVKSNGSKKGKALKLKAATASIGAGQKGTLKLKLSKGALKKAKAALKRRAKLTAKIGVEVADAASNTSAGALSLKLH